MGIQIKRIGHVGILVSDFERSFKFYTEVLGCKVTSRRERPDGSETAFLRFEDTHHDFVIASAPEDVDVSSAVGQRERLVQQIAFEVENRDEFMKALAHLHTKGVKIVNGPLTHGIESGGNLEGSGSRSFYFNDPPQPPGDFHRRHESPQWRGVPPEGVRRGPEGLYEEPPAHR